VATTSLRFTGFPKEAIEFLDDLEQNNERAWFQAHKDVYERACKEPMQALMAELEPAHGPGKLFRIQRDIRFSKDKSPYKTYVAATLGEGYVSLSSDGLSIASGVYMPERETLERYRAAIDDDSSGRALERIATNLEKKGYELGSRDALKSAPKGYSADHPRIRFLREKGLIGWKGFPPGPWLHSRKALDRVRTVLDDLRALRDWFTKNVQA
jgi:uncharacterized protein (TIGR02453 family)